MQQRALIDPGCEDVIQVPIHKEGTGSRDSAVHWSFILGPTYFC